MPTITSVPNPFSESYDSYAMRRLREQQELRERERRARDTIDDAIARVDAALNYTTPTPTPTPTPPPHLNSFYAHYAAMAPEVDDPVWVEAPDVATSWTVNTASSARIYSPLDELLGNVIPTRTPEPTTPSSNYRWPIGTIIKWDISRAEVKSHLDMQGRSNRNLLKILGYNRRGNSITHFRYIGECVDSVESEYNVDYFVEATPAEARRYESEMAAMRQCTTRPEIGTVLEYIAPNSGRTGKRGVVISHERGDHILFHWFNNVRSDETIDYHYFRISDLQRHGFTPNPEDYCQCLSCNNTRLRSLSLHVTGNVFFCGEDCAHASNYVQCECCRGFVNISPDESECHHLGGQQVACNACFERHYGACDSCNGIWDRRGMAFDNENQTYTCHRCLDNANRIIHDHSFRPSFQFQKMAWENTRYLGIELEIEVNGDEYQRKALAQAIKQWLSDQPKTADVLHKDGKLQKGKTLDKLVYLKSDGSLRNGIEIVFHPFTLKSFHKNFPLKQFLQFLKDNLGVANDRCGMHVHVSKERLSTLDLIKGKWFFHKCQPFLKRFSERSTFNYCKFDEHVPRKDPYYQDFGHYSVLNLASPSCKTLEVRLFKATLDYTKFLANLQFSDVFVDYIQNGPGAVFLRRSSPHVVWQSFIDYAKNQNRYHIMTKWILTRAIV